MTSRTSATLRGIVIGAVAVGALWAADRNRGVEPAVETHSVPDHEPVAKTSPVLPDAPQTTVPPADKGDRQTILRARCVLPDGVHAKEVSAWFRASPDDLKLNYPATIEGDIVTVHAPFGRGQLSIHVEGCVVQTHEVDAPNGRTSDIDPFELQRAYPLRGRVVDERGAPVTNAFIYPNVGDLSVPLTSTDDDGRFEFDGLPAGKAILRVECETMVRRIVKYAHAADAEPIEIVLLDGVRLLGQVFDAQGEPIDAVYASVVDTAAPDNRARMAFPSIADNGTFHVRLAPGRYRVRANHDGRAAIETVDIIEGQDAFVTLRFAAK